MGAKQAILELLKANVGREVSRKRIIAVVGTSEWGRRIRELRGDGWAVETTKNGYILKSSKQSSKKQLDARGVNRKLRFKIIQRANGACQSCGAKVRDGAILVVDHKVPHSWGGKTVDDNLWAICEPCNQGKKAHFSDQNADLMREVMSEGSAKGRILALFKALVGKKIGKDQLMLVSRISEWARRVRELRDEGWPITSFNEDPKLKPGEYVLRTLKKRGG